MTAAKCVYHLAVPTTRRETWKGDISAIELHRNRFGCCVRPENGRKYSSEWAFKQLLRFVKKLRLTDEVAVEVTGNTRLFYDAVRLDGSRVGP